MILNVSPIIAFHRIQGLFILLTVTSFFRKICVLVKDVRRLFSQGIILLGLLMESREDSGTSLLFGVDGIVKRLVYIVVVWCR